METPVEECTTVKACPAKATSLRVIARYSWPREMGGEESEVTCSGNVSLKSLSSLVAACLIVILFTELVVEDIFLDSDTISVDDARDDLDGLTAHINRLDEQIGRLEQNTGGYRDVAVQHVKDAATGASILPRSPLTLSTSQHVGAETPAAGPSDTSPGPHAQPSPPVSSPTATQTLPLAHSGGTPHWDSTLLLIAFNCAPCVGGYRAAGTIARLANLYGQDFQVLAHYFAA